MATWLEVIWPLPSSQWKSHQGSDHNQCCSRRMVAAQVLVTVGEADSRSYVRMTMRIIRSREMILRGLVRFREFLGWRLVGLVPQWGSRVWKLMWTTRMAELASRIARWCLVAALIPISNNNLFRAFTRQVLTHQPKQRHFNARLAPPISWQTTTRIRVVSSSSLPAKPVRIRSPT